MLVLLGIVNYLDLTMWLYLEMEYVEADNLWISMIDLCPIYRTPVLLEDMSYDGPFSDGGFLCGSPEFEGGSGLRKENASRGLTLCLKDYKVKPIGNLDIQNTSIDNAPRSPDVTTP
ncbi:hypothetical protein KC19_VG262900 [Ceratodon purpureus]|uniref:Uncharacterized protein n=1 Tax=Ceratodon purpureus TaxID=3225 RepID=A0A8T0HUN0_CERPU|nr:hypothetical protein KC19_VG262900 [Ceratodon purpureus]